MIENANELTLPQLHIILLALEHSVETPVARRQGTKACMYCASFREHDPLCALNNALIRLIADEDTPELKAEIITILRDMSLISHVGLIFFPAFINDLISKLISKPDEKLCPKCNRDMTKHPDGEWVCHHTHIL